MSKYLIKLKPLTSFFFGGEETFGEGEVNYSVKSNYLPQQTTLLGMLRYELLAQNGLLGADPLEKKWADLIGDKSFENSEKGYTSSFGAISKLSPVFIIDDETPYIVEAMDWANEKIKVIEKDSEEKEKSILSPIHLNYASGVDAFTNQFLNKKCPVLTTNNGKPYDPKLNPMATSLWVSADGTIQRPWDYDDNIKEKFKKGFFAEKTQIGIHRNLPKSKTDKGDFYKQKSYSFADTSACFAFNVDIHLPESYKFVSRIIIMGGERSVFEMTVEPNTSTNFETIFTADTFKKSHASRTKSVILTSDAYVDMTALTDFDFMICDSLPFRNITTKQKKEFDYIGLETGNKVKNEIRNQTKDKLQKTKELVYLLKRGSILYYSKDIELDPIFSNSAFQNIGYNQYVSIQ